MDSHLGYEKYSPPSNNTGNSCNGNYLKTIQTEHRQNVVHVPRGCTGEFEPVVVSKHQNRGLLIERLEISLYAKGMSMLDIEDELNEIYGVSLLSSAISLIINKVTQTAAEWQNRPLDRLYMVVWMDGIVFKVRESCKVINKIVYLYVGLNNRDYKKVLRI